jgi:predicted ABC-type ATPase
MPKTIYVVGGTNGVGKSTIREKLLEPHIPYINADFIALHLKTQQASLMLAVMAREYGTAQMKKYIAAEQSFAFENNLHEADTYRWLEEMQKKGYCIEIFYIGVDNLETTTKRIQERVKRGEHHVPPDEVYARYKNGLNLLRQYFFMPDKLYLLDNSEIAYTCLEAAKGQIMGQLENLPPWVSEFVQSLEQKKSISIKELSSMMKFGKAMRS